MARLLRIEIPNGVYYVSTRGLERQGIVRDEGDCAKWFQLLDAVATRRRWRVFAWAMMPSHFHLLLETPDGDLSAGMHDLNSGYATAFNRRHGRSGPLRGGGGAGKRLMVNTRPRLPQNLSSLARLARSHMLGAAKSDAQYVGGEGRGTGTIRRGGRRRRGR